MICPVLTRPIPNNPTITPFKQSDTSTMPNCRVRLNALCYNPRPASGVPAVSFKRIRFRKVEAMKDIVAKKNLHDTRESWLRSGAGELRPYFASSGFPIPENIRFAIAFPSTGRRGARIGECWHSSTSEDDNFEIIIRADIADPVEVLGVLVHELVHVVLPVDA